MAVKPYKVTKEINGKEYTAQFVSAATTYDAIDESTMSNGVRSERKYAEFILSNVIVNPKGLTLDDFENTTESGEVVSFGAEVMQGNLKPAEEDKKKTTKE